MWALEPSVGLSLSKQVGRLWRNRTWNWPLTFRSKWTRAHEHRSSHSPWSTCTVMHTGAHEHMCSRAHRSTNTYTKEVSPSPKKQLTLVANTEALFSQTLEVGETLLGDAKEDVSYSVPPSRLLSLICNAVRVSSDTEWTLLDTEHLEVDII